MTSRDRIALCGIVLALCDYHTPYFRPVLRSTFQFAHDIRREWNGFSGLLIDRSAKGKLSSTNDGFFPLLLVFPRSQSRQSDKDGELGGAALKCLTVGANQSI